MRRMLLFALLAALLPVPGMGQRVSVSQLEQILAAQGTASGKDSGGSDLLAEVEREDELAPRLSVLELSERLTEETRVRLEKAYKLGPMTRDALELLADRSALLDPPPGELPPLPAPDVATQRAMLHAAGRFVFQSLSHLPNFFAQRVTLHFDDAPIYMSGQLVSADPSIHQVATLRHEITYRDGREVLTPVEEHATETEQTALGMQTRGEFGPEPAIVFMDVAHGSLAFHHWEKTPEGGVAAVFRYAVPAQASHYEVDMTCGASTMRRYPAYHGSLEIDPEQGVVVRLTLETDPIEGDPLAGIASVIEYGPVVLGSRPYICPLRSLAFSVQQANACNAHERKYARPVTYLNRTSFADYHRLGSESTILATPGGPKAAGPTPEQNSDPE